MWTAIRQAVLITVLVAVPSSDKPHLVVRAFPLISLPQGLGCSVVLLTAEIKGLEDEQWYCPKVTWEMPDGTQATEESDCAPYAEREDYPRIWRRKLCAPSHPNNDAWSVWVRLSKNDKTLARQEIRFWVKG